MKRAAASSDFRLRVQRALEAPSSFIAGVAVVGMLLAQASGCAFPRDECSVDADCGQGQCTRNGECVTAGALLSARISWTLYGQPPNEASCAPVEQLAVTFIDVDTDDNVTFSPVTCTLGQIFFDRMAARHDEIKLTAFAPDGDRLDSARGPLPDSENELMFDLEP